MQVPKRHLSRHRRQRLVLWVLAMLAWIASVLAGKPIGARQGRQRGHVSLDGLTRMVTQLLIVRAGELARLRRRRRFTYFKRGRDLRCRHLFRSLIGSRLRRAMKRKHIGARIAVMIHVLRHLDAYARPLAQRMRRRLTRLWAITPRPMPATPLNDAPLLLPALADSS
jgi:hypothetical protein